MYVIPPYTPSVTLYGADGSSRAFESVTAALKALGYPWIRRCVGPSLDAPNPFEHTWDPVTGHTNRPYRFVLADESGRVLLLEDFAALLPSHKATRACPGYSIWRRALCRWNGTGPVPGTGRSHWASMFRHPRTTAAKRAAALVLKDELEPPVRAKRNARNLPSTWDDIQFSSRYIDNWKRYRKTQYRERGGSR